MTLMAVLYQVGLGVLYGVYVLGKCNELCHKFEKGAKQKLKIRVLQR